MLKNKYLSFLVAFLFSLFLILSCSSGDDGNPPKTPDPAVGEIIVNPTILNFGGVMVNTNSGIKTFSVKATDLSDNLKVNVTGKFKISLDQVNFSNEININKEEFSDQQSKTIYVVFQPEELENSEENIILKSEGISDKIIKVTGNGIPRIYNYQTFSNTRLAFGGGHSQYSIETFTLHNDLSNIEKINMYIKLNCPSQGCNAWDVYANILIKDQESGEWYEIGRYITPYGVNTSKTPRGLEIDVTDFKSLLTGQVEMKAYIEVWGADGWLVSVDFDFIEGTPDYPYYAVSRVIQYNENSLEGVIYGEDASAFDLTKTIQIPANAQSTTLRTIITGWGHATPLDAGGRGCAEWCFRTHDVKINGTNTFQHNLNSIGCNSNPIQPQNGNWNQNRAGWCPGMAVPVRTDNLSNTMAGQSFTFEYAFQPWTNNLQANIDNPHAYYALSTFVVVKSNTPITKPIVNE